MSNSKSGDPRPYNPLEKKQLGHSVAEAMLISPAVKLSLVKSFQGAGIYAIYYSGDYRAYHSLAKKNAGDNPSAPIYVGKAVPAGARKGGFGLDAPAGQVLFKRLSEHAESIRQAQNLDLNHFYCRYLVTDDIWIPLGENLLIEMFYPLWNMVIDGFGNHAPGSGRDKQQKSAWDTLHPGRKWAVKLPPNSKTKKQIEVEISRFLLKNSN